MLIVEVNRASRDLTVEDSPCEIAECQTQRSLPGRYRVRPSQREGVFLPMVGYGIIPSLWEGRPLGAGEGSPTQRAEVMDH